MLAAAPGVDRCPGRARSWGSSLLLNPLWPVRLAAPGGGDLFDALVDFALSHGFLHVARWSCSRLPADGACYHSRRTNYAHKLYV